MRKVCNHPDLFLNGAYDIDENIVRASGKFELLNRMLPKLKAAGHRYSRAASLPPAFLLSSPWIECLGLCCCILLGVNRLPESSVWGLRWCILLGVNRRPESSVWGLCCCIVAGCKPSS